MRHKEYFLTTTLKSDQTLVAGNQAKVKTRRFKFDIGPYLFLAPALIMYAAFFLYPAYQLVYLSFQKWDGINEKSFVGIENYEKLLFGDPIFWVSFKHNLYWLFAAVVVPVLIGLFLAILLSRSKIKGRVIFRTIYFLPQVLSSVVVAIIWNWIYNPSYGALNTFLEMIGLGVLKRGWLGDMDLALIALFIAWSWVHYGFCMVVFIAALQGIDEVYFDAAKVDGANWFQQFRYVLVPFIQKPLTTIILITAISAFQVFDLVYVTTKGGPANATMVLPIHMIKNAFSYHRIGYGSAIAVALGVIILVLSVLFLRASGVFKENV
jgi:ABC-type sugar transport system permease subunit